MHFSRKLLKPIHASLGDLLCTWPVRLTSHQLGLVLMQWHHLVHQQERIRNRLKRHTTSFLKHSSSADDRRRSMALIEDARSTMMDRLMEP